MKKKEGNQDMLTRTGGQAYPELPHVPPKKMKNRNHSREHHEKNSRILFKHSTWEAMLGPTLV